MLKDIIKFVMALLFALVLSGAAHSQEVWWFDETYSNADGSVQFIVFSKVATNYGGLLAGRTLYSGDEVTGHKLQFPGDAPAALASGTFTVLVGTQGFADLNVVKPDFVVPNGFVATTNGSFSIGRCGVSYTTLPTDGAMALYLGGCEGSADANPPSVSLAVATNFAGQSYSFANFGGLWWHAPAGSEPGWGIAVEHQRDIVFAAWATYDTDGSPAWFVMPRAEQLGNRYEGAIYRTTGPAFSAVPFDPSTVSATQVGRGDFKFSSTGDSTFSYTIGMTSATKAITRQIFADPVPVCQIVATPGPVPNYQGLWWNAAAGSEAGWGLHLSHQGDVIFAVWFTYDAEGKAMWFAMTASKTAPNNYAGAIYQTRGPAFSAASFDPAAVTETQIGTGTVAFADRSNGAFAYVVDGVAQTKNITRQIFANPPAICN